ncbi:MAG TPA: acyltransferase [Terracidiphilus sp.]|nr:acyltransferase [Terracidiphilus sp.]
MDTLAASSVVAAPTGQAVARPRDLYIDRLRSLMTALVILHHTAITYGAIGGWFWYELKPSAAWSSQILIQFCTTNQAYFMGFFFLLAAYFTPASLERKGYGQFIADRFRRLGLPLLAFILILGPFTAALSHWGDTGRFWEVFPYLLRHVILIPGPMWFVEALLIFTLAYCAWRAVAGAPLKGARRTPRPFPSTLTLLWTALATGLAALLIRQVSPVGVVVASFQLAYFAPYILLFAVGIAAWRYDWLRQLEWRNVRVIVWVAVLAWPLMPAAAIVSNIVYGGKGNFATGFSWPALVYAFWEPLVAWGFIAAWLLLARKWMNQPSRFWTWVNRRAYAVYIIHPPVLVGVALLLHGWAAPALVKFCLTGMLACAASWLAADPLVRLPGVRRVV